MSSVPAVVVKDASSAREDTPTCAFFGSDVRSVGPMDNGKGSFWTSLGGVLTAVAGVLTAGAAVAALVIGTGGSGDKKGSAASPSPPASATPEPKEVTL